MSAQQLLGFPFPGSAHMLGLAGFAALGQQLNNNGFTPPKSEMLVSLTPHMVCLSDVLSIQANCAMLCNLKILWIFLQARWHVSRQNSAA